jgi:N-acetylneuraminic acid mutarotase
MKHKYPTLIPIFLIIVFNSFINSNLHSQTTPDWWQNLAPMPVAEGGAGSAVLNGKIYFAGGVRDMEAPAFDTVVVYDPENNSWSAKTSLQNALCFLTLDTVNGKLYKTGGANSWFGEIVNVVEEYDTEKDVWISKSEIPDKRYCHGSCTLGNKIYIFGGLHPDFTAWPLTNFVYDPATDQWSQIKNLISARVYPSCCVFDNKIYLFGGFSGSNLVEHRVDVYDPGSDTFTPVTTMPDSRTGQLAFEFDNKIYLIGDKPPIYTYDPINNNWQEMDSIPEVHGMGMREKIGNYIYMFGGLIDTTGEHDFVAIPDAHRIDLSMLKPKSEMTETVELQSPNNATNFQIYPNPFSLKTIISYQLPLTGNVELSVYDLTGRKVTTLVNEKQQAGRYEIEWNAEGVKPGIYLCKLKLAGVERTVKLVVSH